VALGVLHGLLDRSDHGDGELIILASAIGAAGLGSVLLALRARRRPEGSR